MKISARSPRKPVPGVGRWWRGGDGTVAAVAAGLVGSEVPFGVLPAGTLNHFAKDLGLPLELEAAARMLLSGHVIRVDLGEVNGRIFVNNSSVGFYPQIVRERERQQRGGRAKWAALASATAAVFRSSRTMELSWRSTTDGGCSARRWFSSATTATRFPASRLARARGSTAG